MEENILEVDDFDLKETKLEYQIWLLGYDENHFATDFEYLVDTYDTGLEATKCATFFSELENIKLLSNKDENFNIPKCVKYISIVVETVVDCGSIEENIDFLYEAEVNVNEEDK